MDGTTRTNPLGERLIDRIPEFIEFRGYEYDLNRVYQADQEGIARVEAHAIRNGGSLGCPWGYTRATVKRVVVEGVTFWAVYAAGA